jgi:hypothetical protein
MLGQISILTLKEGNTLNHYTNQVSISDWRADDHDQVVSEKKRFETFFP